MGVRGFAAPGRCRASGRRLTAWSKKWRAWRNRPLFFDSCSDDVLGRTRSGLRLPPSCRGRPRDGPCLDITELSQNSARGLVAATVEPAALVVREIMIPSVRQGARPLGVHLNIYLAVRTDVVFTAPEGGPVRLAR